MRTEKKIKERLRESTPKIRIESRSLRNYNRGWRKALEWVLGEE